MSIEGFEKPMASKQRKYPLVIHVAGEIKIQTILSSPTGELKILTSLRTYTSYIWYMMFPLLFSYSFLAYFFNFIKTALLLGLKEKILYLFSSKCFKL